MNFLFFWEKNPVKIKKKMVNFPFSLKKLFHFFLFSIDKLNNGKKIVIPSSSVTKEFFFLWTWICMTRIRLVKYFVRMHIFIYFSKKKKKNSVMNYIMSRMNLFKKMAGKENAFRWQKKKITYIHIAFNKMRFMMIIIVSYHIIR